MLSRLLDHPRKEVNEAMGRIVAVALVPIIALMGVAVVGTPAEAISCVGAGDVTALGPAGCTQGGLTFSDFSVAAAGFTGVTIFLSSLSATVGQDVNLNFQVAHDPSPVSLADILFSYTVTGGGGATLNGIDLFNPGQNVTIREVACGDPFVNGVCGGTPLANLLVGPNSNLAASFDPDAQIFIRKDIQFGIDSFISEFTQSHDLTPVPEPATLVLLGSTLAGLGVFSRRKLRHKQAQDV
ncbi:MAG TPA: PEP-CTERM sorting domain-containing protein [Methylomirabilota bacterium]